MERDHPVFHGTEAPSPLPPAVSPAAERLRYILGEDDEPPNPTLFTEMDTLQHDGDEMEWKESARSARIWECGSGGVGVEKKQNPRPKISPPRKTGWGKRASVLAELKKGRS